MAIKLDPQAADKVLRSWLETRGMNFRDQLVAYHLPLVSRLCHRFQQLGEPLDNLLQVGTIGLIKAIDIYNPQLNNNLAVFAIPLVVGEIKNHFRDRGWAAKLPGKLQNQKLFVDQTVEALTQELGRSPKMAEIAETAGLSQEEVFQTFEVERLGNPLSGHTETSQSSDKQSAGIVDYPNGESPPKAASEPGLLAHETGLKAPLMGFDPRQQIVLYLKLYSGLSESDIARRLCISNTHVSRLQRHAAAKLRLSLRECVPS